MHGKLVGVCMYKFVCVCDYLLSSFCAGVKRRRNFQTWENLHLWGVEYAVTLSDSWALSTAERENGAREGWDKERNDRCRAF